MPATATEAPAWITRTSAAAVLGVCYHRVPVVAAAGACRIKRMPGMRRTLYSRRDLQRIAESGVTLAGDPGRIDK